MSSRWVERLNIFLIFFFAAGLLVYFLLNGGAYWRIIRYYLLLNSPFAGEDLKQGDILKIQGAASAASGEDASYHLLIPKIEVSAPVIIPGEKTKGAILASLEEGVGLYPDSAQPGQSGRAVILGHSSHASWYRGDYAYVFSLLPKLSEGDEFYITTKNKKYTYTIFSKTILSPAEANDLLNSPTPNSEVNLVTCYPIGSASKRNIIRAQLVKTESI